MSAIKNKQQLALDANAELNRRTKPERRNATLKGFLVGCIKSRRRVQRRSECQAHFPTDWYDTKLFLMALSLLILSITDAAMTMTLLNNGAVEVNPFMNYLLNQSIHVFVYTKLAMTSVCIFILVAHYHSKLFRKINVNFLLSLALLIYLSLVVYELHLYFTYVA